MRISEYDQKQNYLGAFVYHGFDVRLYGSWVRPWFVLEDVKRAAGLPEETQAPQDRKRHMTEFGWLVDELGLYMLLIEAGTPQAMQMAKRVMEDFMPEVRRYRGMKNRTVVEKS